MKHLRKFNEAIIDYKNDNIKSFYDEVKSLPTSSSNSMMNFTSRPGFYTFDSIKEIGERNDIEVVDYKTFYSELPDDQKSTAPPKDTPAFALVNPSTGKARVVINTDRITMMTIDHIYHMLKHENIHIKQMSKMSDKHTPSLPDPKDQKEYFSNKEEVMAFSQSICDMIMRFNPKSMDNAIKMLNRNPLFLDIKKSVDNDTLNRYKKYIYLYLEKEFEYI